MPSLPLATDAIDGTDEQDYLSDNMGVIVVKDFNLDLTVKSGQFFYYEELGDNEFLLINGLDMIKVKQLGNKIVFSGVDEEDLRELLGLTKDYDYFLEEMKVLLKKEDDPLVRRALKNFKGLRIMSQDLHQAIISFICSSNANMKKIKKNVHLLAEKFGSSKSGKKTFPLLKSLNDYEKILSCSTGYRAKYIYKANELLSEEFLEEIKKADYEEAKKLLMTIPGVGPKVADCICLFSLKHYEAFPVDVWVKRVMTNNYAEEIEKPYNEKNILKFAKNHFGKYAGYLQQYLFLEVQRESKE